MLRVAMHGAAGRMGLAIARCASEADDLVISVALDHPGSKALGLSSRELGGAGDVVLRSNLEAIGDVDVVIDFSAPAATALLVEAAARLGKPVMIGTTGLDAAAKRAIDEASEHVAIVVAPNTSVGVTVLFHLAAEAARLLGEDFDAEIVEMHHKHKVDAPSGTAVRLAERVAAARGVSLAEVSTHGRSGQVGARPRGEIGVLALRGGDVIGDHTLVLAGPGERVELTHRAHDRSLFARGALRAARWVAHAPRGLWDMTHVLGLAPVSRAEGATGA